MDAGPSHFPDGSCISRRDARSPHVIGSSDIERSALTSGDTLIDWRWVEAPVDRSVGHLRVVHDDYGPSLVALVGLPKDNVFEVEFLLAEDRGDPDKARILADVRAELDFYLLDVGRPDPWAYAHYHCGTFSNAYGNVHWGVGDDFVGIPTVEIVGDFWGGEYAPLQEALAPLVQEAWRLHRHVASVPEGRAVVPSIPILFFGDLTRYWHSPRRVITVGLNPSKQEFPEGDRWRRFLAGAELAEDPLAKRAHIPYLEELSRYFDATPYREWFDRSFEPVLHGLEASYYAGAANTALHTDIASPVATDPTWSALRAQERDVHRGGAEVWRKLADLLSPDVIVISVAREHLPVVSDAPFGQWKELTRIDRDRPFIVATTEMSVADGRKQAVVAFGRCTNLPFGSVSYDARERIGAQIAAHLDELEQDAPS